MALTVTSDLTILSTCEATTGWTTFSGTITDETDFAAQGGSPAHCLSFAYTGTGSQRGACFNNGSGIDFTSGTHKDKLVYIWLRCSTPGLIGTRAAGGMKVILGSGATAPTAAAGVWSAWYVDGNDTLIGTNGWVCYVIDPQSTPAQTFGGGVNKAAIQWFGATMTTTASVKGQPFGIDQVGYGRGELKVTGTVTNAGEGFKEIAAVDFGTMANRWGIITEKNGIYYVKGKIILGDATGTLALTFTSSGETVVFETPAYYNGTAVVKSIPDASYGGTAGTGGSTTYNGLAIVGNGTGTTSVTIGSIVGSDGGRSGSTFKSYRNANLGTPGRTKADISTTDVASMALSIYGSTFDGLEGTIDLSGTGLSGDDCFGNTFTGCGRINSNMEMRNCNVLNSVTTATDGAIIWDANTNFQKGLFANCLRGIVFESATGTPFTFSGIKFSGNTYDVRNESGAAITLNISDGDTPTYENSGGGSSTSTSSNVSVTLTGLVNPTEVRVYTRDGSGNSDSEIQGQEDVTSGSYTFSAPASSHVNVIIFSVGYLPADIMDFVIPTSAASIPVQQIFDRQYAP